MGLLVVSRIAARNEVTVKLTESDYGGIRAIVLIPVALIADDAPPVRTAAQVEARVPVGTNGHTVAWPTVEPVEPVSVPVRVPAPPERQEPRPTAGRPTLPRRRRQESLAPQLSNTQPRSEPSAGPRHARSPERARDLFSEIESGTRMGRVIRPDPRTNHDDGREG